MIFVGNYGFIVDAYYDCFERLLKVAGEFARDSRLRMGFMNENPEAKRVVAQYYRGDLSELERQLRRRESEGYWLIDQMNQILKDEGVMVVRDAQVLFRSFLGGGLKVTTRIAAGKRKGQMAEVYLDSLRRTEFRKMIRQARAERRIYSVQKFEQDFRNSAVYARVEKG